jgi:hypothetical protein
MARQAAGAPLHRATAGRAAQSHGPRHIAASAGCSLPPMPWYVTVPSGISLRRGLAGRTDDRAHMAWMGAAGHRR